MTPSADKTQQKALRARRAGLVIAGVALYWVIATWAGGALGLSNRVRALFDLFALAGFGYSIRMIWLAFRAGRDDRG